MSDDIKSRNKEKLSLQAFHHQNWLYEKWAGEAFFCVHDVAIDYCCQQYMGSRPRKAQGLNTPRAESDDSSMQE